MRITCSRCHKAFNAPDRWKGQSVECPHCGQVTLAQDSTAGTKLGSAGPVGGGSKKPTLAPDVGAAGAASSKTSHPLQKPSTAQDPDDDLRLLPEHEPTRRQFAGAEWLLEEAQQEPGSRGGPAGGRGGKESRPAQVSPARSAADKGPREPTAATVDCPNCGSELPPDGLYCIDCGYHLGLKRVLHDELGELDLDMSVGYVRWFRRQLAEGESGTGILWLFHILVAIVLSVIGVIGGRQAWFMVAIVAIVYVAVWVYILKLGGIHFLGRQFWRWRLGWLRRFVWPRLPSDEYIVAHDRQFDDQKLADLEALATVRVLDLQGSGITDRALYSLQHCQRLHAIVVKGTRMTRKGVQRLQIMKPDVSIWHDD